MPEQESSRSTCTLCGKPKRGLKSGTLTGWIFDVSGCRCDDRARQRESQADTAQNVCLTCKLPIYRRKRATITQWIFPSAKCNCERPIPNFGNATESDSSISSSSMILSDSAPATPEQQDPELEVIASSLPDRYVPIQRLGQGGLAAVYLARDTVLDRLVAVKILHTMESDQLVRFQREAKIISHLEHPNIVDVYDFGISQNGKPYMVLEYIKGTTLRDVLKTRTTLNSDEARQVFAGVASALAYAYNNGCSYRDLKPENLVIQSNANSEMITKVIDFGLGKYVNPDNSFTTSSGVQLIGTPAYMPPDQANGKQYDVRSEIYSFGCVLFEALVGHPPFSGSAPLEVLAKHNLEEAPTISDLDESVDEDLSILVQKCLSKPPDGRYQSFEEILEILEDSSNELSDVDALSKTDNSRVTEVHAPLAIALVVVLSLSLPLLIFMSIPKEDSQPRPIKPKRTIENFADVFHEVAAVINYSETTKELAVEGFLAPDQYGRLLDYPDVERLSVQNMEHIDPTEFKIIKRLPLKSIDLSGTDADDKTVRILTEIPTLDRIALAKTKITDAGLSELAKLRLLSDLEIDGCLVSDIGISALSKCSALRKLSMKNTARITDKGYNALSILPLEFFNCSGIALQDDALKAISRLTATHYSFQSCGLDDRKIALFRCARATWIDVIDNDIGMGGVLALMNLPSIASITVSAHAGLTPSKVAARRRGLHRKCVVRIVSDIE